MVESISLRPIPETQNASCQQSEGRGVESLNSGCFCVSLDADALKREFEADARRLSVDSGKVPSPVRGNARVRVTASSGPHGGDRTCGTDGHRVACVPRQRARMGAAGRAF